MFWFVLAVPVGTTIQTLTASDPDTGARLEYTIQSDSITAKDSNGNPVTSTTPFDYEVCLLAFVLILLFSWLLPSSRVAE